MQQCEGETCVNLKDFNPELVRQGPGVMKWDYHWGSKLMLQMYGEFEGFPHERNSALWWVGVSFLHEISAVHLKKQELRIV